MTRTPEEASAKALFPIPLPKEGVFTVSSSAGSRERRRKSFDQAVHITVMALNFWYFDYKFPPLSQLTLAPSPPQARVLDGIRNVVKAFGSCEDTFQIPPSGRRCTSLISQLADLSDFVSWEGLAGASYSRGFKGSEESLASLVHVPVDKTRAPELTPYSSLNPDRLKIAGSAQWDPSFHMSDSLWMAFCEPASLRWTENQRTPDAPDLNKEDYQAVKGLLKIWDAKGLLFLRDELLPEGEADLSMRFFNCHKNLDVDRMIGDRRSRNFVEGTIPGASQCLPPALMLANLELRPFCDKACIYVSDRKDFYHQMKVTSERAATNALWPPIFREDLEGTFALASWCERNLKRTRYDRLKHGDLFKPDCLPKPRKHQNMPGLFQGCFASVPQGDHLGVEFAVDAHRNLLRSHGLLHDREELRADRLFKGRHLASGLVIDDFYAVSVQHVSTRPEASLASQRFQVAMKAYNDQKLLGSAKKDVVGADKAKITGAELDTSEAVRKLGMATLASPMTKRLSLAHVSLELARLRVTTDQLHQCLIGGWVHSLLFRRPMMSLLDASFKLVDNSDRRGDNPRVLPLSRQVAQELVMLAVLCPFMSTDLTASLSSTVFATDSSDRKGAFVAAEVTPDTARALWRSGRKKGGYTRMLSRTQALLKKLDPSFVEPWSDEEGPQAGQVPRPLALRFHFLEICGGAGKVAAALSRCGWTVGPVIDLDRSRFFDLSDLRVISWIYHLVESGLLDAFMVEPPCTTFSPAQHPASRGYDQPRGYDPLDPKTLTGTTLALRSLALIDLASDSGCPGLLEQPRRTKMRRLEEWQRLLEMQRAHEVWTAGCMFGSIHNKEFVFLYCNMDGEKLHRKCDGSHQHVRIEGQYTKKSAIYTDELAEAIACQFDAALTRKLRIEDFKEPQTAGLESPLCNEVLLSAKWRPVSVWTWRRPMHINILETRVVLALMKRLALSTPGIRQVVALDSNVGLSALAKGRSPSYGLRPCVRKTGATVVAGRLYPAYQFAPTRLNPADHPTSDNLIPEPSQQAWPPEASLEELLDFAEVNMLSRPAANWVRLFTLVRKPPYDWLGPEHSWRFAHFSVKHYPYVSQSASRLVPCRVLDFDSTLGYPGEGPPFVFGSTWLVWIWFELAIGLFTTVAQWAGCGVVWTSGRRSVRAPVRLWIFVGLVLQVQVGSCVSHGPALSFRNPGDVRRAALRVAADLPEGRPVLGKTQVYRDKLLADFDMWLQEDGFLWNS